MPKLLYREKRFGAEAKTLIEQADAICMEYADQGFTLTLRQLYYQFVARDIIPNTMRDYKRLAKLVNDGRLAGLIDWEHVEDRTRNLEALPTWDSPGDILHSAAEGYRHDLWATQDLRIEVWIEKDALAGVIEPVCNLYRVPYFACRGYASASEVWRAAQRFGEYLHARQQILVLHLGDHDPSGVDMTRDIRERLTEFLNLDADGPVFVERIALNMDQIEERRLPPNPAKLTDTRSQGYIMRYGSESWELDALDPGTIHALLEDTIRQHIDWKTWEVELAEESTEKKQIKTFAETWETTQ